MRFSVSVAIAALFYTAAATAQFSPGPNPVPNGTTTGAQTLSGGTGTVDSGGTISVSASAPGVNMTGTSTLNNNGTIQTTGNNARGIDSNSGTANLTVNNTGLISVAGNTDAFRVNTAASSVNLTNSGTIRVLSGGQAIDWAAIASGTNTLTNMLGGFITATGEDAVRPGQNGVVNNAGTIQATVTVSAGTVPGADGIDLRAGKTVTVTNSGTISGRHGIATDGANTGPSLLTVHNNAGSIFALNGSGINVDGANATVLATVNNAFGATIKGGLLSGTTDGDADGIDVDGVLTLNNYGDILGLGAKGTGNNAEGIAAGGGGIFNFAGGRIIGSTLLADAPNGDATKVGNGILIDDSNGGNAVAATTVTNSGEIWGKSGFGVKFIGNFADTITNHAGGLIRGAGTGAAIQMGGGADTLTNRGFIVSDNGNAIDLEGGNDKLIIEGGAASITGNVSGGTGTNSATFNLGAGNGFAYSGLMTNFSTLEVQSGTLTLDGANRIDSSSALLLSGGTLALVNAGANGQTFASFSLTSDSTIALTLSSLSFNALGTVAGGETLGVTGWDSSVSPDYAFRIFGNLTGDSAFLALISGTTVNSYAAAYNFDGAYTNVNAVPIPAAGVLLLSGLGVFGVLGRRRRRVAQVIPAGVG